MAVQGAQPGKLFKGVGAFPEKIVTIPSRGPGHDRHIRTAPLHQEIQCGLAKTAMVRLNPVSPVVSALIKKPDRRKGGHRLYHLLGNRGSVE